MDILSRAKSLESAGKEVIHFEVGESDFNTAEPIVTAGIRALKEGKTVVHYTLELQDTVVATRYDSCLTGYPLSDIANFKDEIYEAVK